MGDGGDYERRLRTELGRALCLQPFPCRHEERQSKPEVEFQGDAELLLEPVLVADGPDACLVEASINSARVSFKFGRQLELDAVLAEMHARFMMQRAEALDVLRRRPVPGYDISFLVTDRHVQAYGRAALVAFLVQFAQEAHRQAEQLKAEMNSRGRAVATDFMKALAF